MERFRLYGGMIKSFRPPDVDTASEDYIAPKIIKSYICGPTVYDSAHIGHARTYVTFDAIHRVIRDYFGHELLTAMNITDIDDKIFGRVRESGQDATKESVAEFTGKYTNEFMEDMAALGVQPPDFIARVTDYIDSIIKMIQDILNRGYAYESGGSVYFDCLKYGKTHQYGVFTGQQIDDVDGVDNGNDGDSNPTVCRAGDKNNKADFALWKAAKPGEPSWDSPWGPGRPGWHIECSAISTAIFGSYIDIHGGGIDLCFPHHENEIAQNMAANDHEGVNYFVHIGHLHIDGCKMSKSLKNFITIRDALKKYSARELRLFFLAHSRTKPLVYSEDAMTEIQVLDRRFDDLINRNIDPYSIPKDYSWRNDFDDEFEATRRGMQRVLYNNIRVDNMIYLLNRLVGLINSHFNERGKTASYVRAVKYVKNMLAMVGLEYESHANRDDGLKLLVNLRTSLRQQAIDEPSMRSELFKITDKLRDDILSTMGVRLQDS